MIQIIISMHLFISTWPGFQKKSFKNLSALINFLQVYYTKKIHLVLPVFYINSTKILINQKYLLY